MNDPLPNAMLQTTRESFLSRISIVWAFPVLAAAIALFLGWQNYNARGPVIEIAFPSGDGLSAGETTLRFREITVGLVEKVRLSEDLEAVIAQVRLDPNVAPFVDESASFWIVQPEVTTRGISGLGTVLSGVYIQGAWDNEAGSQKTRFEGLESAPLLRADRPGLRIKLRTQGNSQITNDAPILYRGIEVGQVGNAQIDQIGGFATADALIYEEYRRLVNTNTRFWDMSGVNFSLGTGGAEVNFGSLASLLSGGVTFETIISGGNQPVPGHMFEIFPSEAEARAEVFSVASGVTLDIAAIFSGNVEGLSNGAPVTLNGLRIGEVTNLVGLVDPLTFGDNKVRLSVSMRIETVRLGLPGEVSRAATLDFLENRIANGMRARLATGSLFSGGLRVEFVDVEDTGPAVITFDSLSDLPVIPTTEDSIVDVDSTAQGVISRFNDLPIEELLGAATDFFAAAASFASDQELRETPGDVRALVGDIRGLVSSEETQHIPTQIASALASFDAILKDLENQQAVTRLTAAVDATYEAAEGVFESVEGVPKLVESLDVVAKQAQEVDFAGLAGSAQNVLNSAEALIASEDTARLPSDLSSALAELRLVLTELREGGAVANVNQTLSSARRAADAFATSTGDLPSLVARLNGVLAQANDTLESFDENSRLNKGAQQAMREIQQAADAITDLARTIQRNPNSLLLGR